MKFKTIVLKKKHIAMLSAVLMSAGTLFAVSAYKSGQTMAVFSQNDMYEGILKEGLPGGGGFSLKGLLDSLLGFDTQKPETIIEEYSPIFEGSSEETPVPEQTAEPVPDVTPIPTVAPVPVQLPSGENICRFTGVSVSNATSYAIDTTTLPANNLGFNIARDGSAEILIVHTHTTESYGDYGERNTDCEKNVTAVGAAMKAVFEQYGIGTIHDTTVHDYPSYQGAYTRELNTIEKNLAANPSIKIVLDVHRDGYVYADGSKLKKTAVIDGESTAQVMIVSGTDSMGLYNPSWRENLNFAAKIQSAAAQMYPNLMRPIDLRRERFNMHLTKGSLLLEVGANGNTIEEAKRGGELSAHAIAAVLCAQ